MPGALWGAVGAVMRFVPYVGPLIAAIFPIALFCRRQRLEHAALDCCLIVILELTSNIVRAAALWIHTGLSAISLIATPIFWRVTGAPWG